MRRLAVTTLPGLLAVTLSAAVLSAISPAAALARPGSAFSQIRQAYERDGSIPTCEFSSPELTAALNALDAYDLEYFADFIAAIQNALTLRAAGACSHRTAHAAEPTRSRTPPAASLPSSLTAPTDSGPPAPLLLLAVLAAVLAAAAVAAGLARDRTWWSGWPASWRHGVAEAWYRAEGLWDALAGRLGR